MDIGQIREIGDRVVEIPKIAPAKTEPPKPQPAAPAKREKEKA